MNRIAKGDNKYKVYIPGYKVDYTQASSRKQAIYLIVRRFGEADKDKIVYWDRQTFGKDKWGVAVSLMDKSPDVKTTIIQEGGSNMKWLKRKASEKDYTEEWKKGDKVIITEDFPIWEGMSATITEVTNTHVSFDVDGENDGSTSTEPEVSFKRVKKDKVKNQKSTDKVLKDLAKRSADEIARDLDIDRGAAARIKKLINENIKASLNRKADSTTIGKDLNNLEGELGNVQDKADEVWEHLNSIDANDASEFERAQSFIDNAIGVVQELYQKYKGE